MDEAKSAARSLRTLSQRGRVVPEIGDESIREIFVKNFRLIYELGEREIVVLAFLHGARRFPGSQ